MAKNDFISDNLVHMRDRLKENAAKGGSAAPSPASGESPDLFPKLSDRAAPSRETATRGDDSVRRKREFAEKLERDRAAVAAAIEVESGKLEELRRFEHALDELGRDFDRLGPVDTPEGMRELEKLCFAHYRAAGRASVFLNGRGAGPAAPSRPEEASGFRRRCADSLPLAAALVAAALIVALTLIFLFY